MRQRAKLVLPLFLLGISLSLWYSFPATAQNNGWSQPFPVSDIRKTPSSWFPDLAIGPDESVHIVWSSGLPGTTKEDTGSDLLMYREFKNGAWSAINDIDNTGSWLYTVRN